MDSVNDDEEYWETEITVSYEAYNISGSLTGVLRYTLLHPCLLNVPQFTFTTNSRLIEYSVCQKEDAAGADFSWTDSISELTSIPNYCGVPNFEAVFDGVYTAEWKEYLTLNITSAENAGFVSYGAGMCTRDLAVSTPY